MSFWIYNGRFQKLVKMPLIVWGAEWSLWKSYYQLTVFVLKWIKCNLLLIEVYDIADVWISFWELQIIFSETVSIKFKVKKNKNLEFEPNHSNWKESTLLQWLKKIIVPFFNVPSTEKQIKANIVLSIILSLLNITVSQFAMLKATNQSSALVTAGSHILTHLLNHIILCLHHQF